jgi:hypothetical protein
MKTRKLSVVAPVTQTVVKSKEVRAAEKLATLEANISCDIDFSKKLCDEFTVKFTSDPSYAFEWSASAFQAAAKLNVASHLNAIIEKVKSKSSDEYLTTADPIAVITTIKTILLDDVIRGARFPEKSTSLQSNAMATEIIAAKAEYLERITRLLERLED